MVRGMGEEKRVFWVWELSKERAQQSYCDGRPRVVYARSAGDAARDYVQDAFEPEDDPLTVRALDPHTGESEVFRATMRINLVPVNTDGGDANA